MRFPFIACPLCSVLLPGTDADSEKLGVARTPWIRIGTHSKKVFFSRAAGCNHGPNLPDRSESAEVFGAWDEWARAEAVKRADVLGYSPRRRALFFYLLGMATMNEVLALAQDAPAPTAVQPEIPLTPMFDREDRKRVVPISRALPNLP